MQYWRLPKYIQITQFFRNILYEPLPDAIYDLDCAIYWICKEAAAEIDYNLQDFYSAKIWIDVRARYESANLEAPNYKAFEALLRHTPTTIG